MAAWRVAAFGYNPEVFVLEPVLVEKILVAVYGREGIAINIHMTRCDRHACFYQCLLDITYLCIIGTSLGIACGLVVGFDRGVCDRVG